MSDIVYIIFYFIGCIIILFVGYGAALALLDRFDRCRQERAKIRKYIRSMDAYLEDAAADEGACFDRDWVEMIAYCRQMLKRKGGGR
jgi:hypothetical protein